MCAPTLCYELNFPRSLRIRKRFLIKRFVEMLFLIQLIGACIQQWVLPLVHNSLKPLSDMDAARVIERLLKLAIPNHFIWLMFFYWFFHSTLNVIAEVLKNSDTVNSFWSNWNIPASIQAIAEARLFQVTGICCSFYVYLVSVPLHMFKLWAFMGMLGQVPLAIVQVKYIHGKYGNMVVWLSLILGQPIAILAYYHDFYINSQAYVAFNIPANQTDGI
ncbi:DGAT1-like protein [Mya arenaria]|uniref:diacylglycerol O-acyltransferase n=1 Tax=Mya arenaria TaxID=6604 RepID=A0ABY7ETP2_MYAAR|nr:DGAT1-like protein [Mya arenaria]